MRTTLVGSPRFNVAPTIAAVALTIALALIAAPRAHAATTVGTTFLDTPTTAACGSPCTTSTGSADPPHIAPGGLTVPTAGVLTAWRVEVGPASNPATVAIRVIRGVFGAGRGPSESLPAAAGVYPFTARLAVQAGDRIGIDITPTIAATEVRVAGGIAGFRDIWIPPLPEGNDGTGGPASGKVFLQADVEPDADGDGFGDETQDQCPALEGPSNGCPATGEPPPDTDPPDATIIKGAPNKTDKSKVKFKFTSDDPSATFECSLKGRGLDQAVKQFGDCDSPRKYKRLEEGKFTFQVRAFDAAGNVDPSPAKDKFKIVG